MSKSSSFKGPVERKVKSTDGTWIYADASGDSSLPPIVFIHGYGCSSSVFDQIFTDAQLLAKFHLVRYDLRGFGWSDVPEDASAVESSRFAEDFAAVCQAFKLKRPVLAGWSYGATISADVVAHLGADYISGVIFITAQPYLTAGTSARVLTPYLHSLGPGLITADDVSLARETHLKFAYSFSSSPSVPPGVLSGWIGAMTHVTPQGTALILARVQDAEPFLAAGRAGMPALIIQATQDAYIVLDQMEKELQMFSEMTVKTLEGGHIIFYDAYGEFVKTILDFAERYTQ